MIKMSWLFSPYTIFDFMNFRSNGYCYRDIVNYPDIGKSYPIIEPYFHCESGIIIPLILALCGIGIFYLYLKEVEVIK